MYYQHPPPWDIIIHAALAHNSGSCGVDGRDGQVCRFHLPHLHRVKPDVWLHVVTMAIISLWCVEDVRGEEAGVRLKVVVLKSRPDLRGGGGGGEQRRHDNHVTTSTVSRMILLDVTGNVCVTMMRQERSS